MLTSGFSESKELIPVEILICISSASFEWLNTVWRMGFNTLNFSISTKSSFCICCNAETFVGAKLRERNNCSQARTLLALCLSLSPHPEQHLADTFLPSMGMYSFHLLFPVLLSALLSASILAIPEIWMPDLCQSY